MVGNTPCLRGCSLFLGDILPPAWDLIDLFTATGNDRSERPYICKLHLNLWLVFTDRDLHKHCMLVIRYFVFFFVMHISHHLLHKAANWPSGKASVSGAGDRRFESCIGRYLFFSPYYLTDGTFIIIFGAFCSSSYGRFVHLTKTLSGVSIYLYLYRKPKSYQKYN